MRGQLLARLSGRGRGLRAEFGCRGMGGVVWVDMDTCWATSARVSLHSGRW